MDQMAGVHDHGAYQSCLVLANELYRKAAGAVLWLHVQCMDFFGSLGSVNTCHTVFQGGKVPEPFTSVTAVQMYLNMEHVSLFCFPHSLPACPNSSSSHKVVGQVQCQHWS
jgi:hypothetical protein